MLSFKKYIKEGAKDGKNTHLLHAEEVILWRGVEGTRMVINAFREFRDILSGNAKNPVEINQKFDGAPAIFAGTDPEDGEFFIAKKGLFAKTGPKFYKSYADIDADTKLSSDLAEKLKIAYTEMKPLGIKNIVQGDMMFTKDDLEYQKIDGNEYITFHPNTIVYAIPKNSDLGNKIASSNMGIVLHTTYEGKTIPEMSAKFEVDLSKINSTPTLWAISSKFTNASGKASFTAKETDVINAKLSNAGKIFRKIAGSTIREIENNPDLAMRIESFNNSLVRKGERIKDTNSHTKKIIKFVEEKFQKEVDKRKTEKGKAPYIEKKEKAMSFFSKNNLKNLKMIFDLQNELTDIKLMIIEKLNSISDMKSFLKTKNGFEVTSGEGFVATDKLTNDAVKLVDRMEFSYANFNADIIKGWDK